MGVRARAFIEAFLLTLLAAGITVAVHRAQWPWLRGHSGIIVAGLYLYLPVILILFRNEDWAEHGLAMPDLKRSFFHLAIALVAVLPLYYLVWFAGQAYIFGQNLQPRQ